LSGLAGLRCLHLFSGVYGTTEVVPFQIVHGSSEKSRRELLSYPPAVITFKLWTWL
jgi:hypothetical protein